MERKQRLRLLPLLLAAAMLLSIYPTQTSQAAVKKSGNGIAGNGTWGINIDIYSSPFTDYADSKYQYAQGAAQWAYGNQGCAWFAASRVKQITGKNCYISDGRTWYNERYTSSECGYSFARGQKMPTGKALACYGHHVSVIEAVQDGQYLVSEGGFSGGKDPATNEDRYKPNHYCIMHIKTKDQVLNESTFGDFIGFVYLTDDAPVFRTDKKMTLPILQPKENGIALSWSAFNLATGYRIYRKDSPSASWVKLKNIKKTTYTDTTAKSGKVYYYRLRAYNKDGEKTIWSKNNKNDSVSGAYLETPKQPAAVASDGKITVTFSAVPGAQKHLLYRKEAGGSFTKIASLSANKRSYTDLNVTSGTTYVYRLIPYTKITGSALKGNAADSAEVLAYKTPQPPKILSVYETVSSETGALSANLWFLGNGSDDYTVYRRVKGTSTWKKRKTIRSTESSRQSGTMRYYSFRDEKVKKGKTYEYTVGCHRVIGSHSLNSIYGKKNYSVYIADKDLAGFLSDFQTYGNPKNSKTRVYRYQNKSNNRRLLKALYAEPSAYNPANAQGGTRTVVSGDKTDPFRKFTGSAYVKVKEQAIRWTAKYIFHCKADVINDYRSTYLNNQEPGRQYIYGKYFYIRKPAGSGICMAPRILSMQKKNGCYYVKYKLEGLSGGTGISDTQYAVLKKERISGSVFWTLYTHNTGKFLRP